MKRKYLFIVLGVSILCLLLGSWFYPFSPMSLYKSYSLDGDNIVIGQYKKKLKDFETLYKTNEKNAPSSCNDVYYSFDLFQQKWLNTKGPVRITPADLEGMKFETRNVRKGLIELDRREPKLNENVKEQLYLVIDTFEGTEDYIEEIKDDQSLSRGDLKTLLYNLRGSFWANLGVVTSFYEECLNDRH